MKMILFLAFTVMISLSVNIVPVFSDEPGASESPDQAPQKDECLLAAKNCGNRVVSLQDKIDRLKEEIAKGTKVYTPEELNVLKQKLEEVNKTLDFLLEN